MDITIREALPAEYPVLLDRLSRAMLPQPFTRWVCGEDDRSLERTLQSMVIELDRLQPHGVVYITEGLQGAALWHRPGYNMGFWQSLRLGLRLLKVLGITAQTRAQLQAYLDIERLHPRSPHYYLSILGVAPEFQNQGIGSALLDYGLAIADREGMPAYLETDTESALRLYLRHGFVIRDRLQVSPTHFTVYLLWREPHSRQSG